MLALKPKSYGYLESLKKVALLRARMFMLRLATNGYEPQIRGISGFMVTDADTLKITSTRTIAVSCPTLLEDTGMTAGDVESTVDKVLEDFEDFMLRLEPELAEFELRFDRVFRGVRYDLKVEE